MINRVSNVGWRDSAQTQHPTLGWVRAVPLPFYEGLFGRMRDAWEVLRGRAYAFYWPKDGEIEIAMRDAKR